MLPILGTQEASVIFTAGPRRDSQLNVGVRFDSEEMVALQANAELPVRTKMPMEFDLTVRLGKRLMARLDWVLRPMNFLKPTVSYAFHNNVSPSMSMASRLTVSPITCTGWSCRSSTST